LIHSKVADLLGVTGYLKHGVHPLDSEKTQCRVASARIRGVPSHGFIQPVSKITEINALDGDQRQHKYGIGDDVSDVFRAVKYEPPAKFVSGDCANDLATFHKYTDIENYYRYPDAIADGTMVRIMEKVHGSNARLGYVFDGDIFDYQAGSHNMRLKQADDVRKCCVAYWRVFTENIRAGLKYMSSGNANNVILFGEIYGPGVQDMDYGERQVSFRAFDLSVNGRYLDYETLWAFSRDFGIHLCPTLYTGPFSAEVVAKYTDGETTLNPASAIKSAFKGREGIVVTPLKEEWSPVLNGRCILKSKSADYIGRRGATDNE
jgi:RNA ligase (TIGR02306 family)